jgi:hypothetical protein
MKMMGVVGDMIVLMSCEAKSICVEGILREEATERKMLREMMVLYTCSPLGDREDGRLKC